MLADYAFADEDQRSHTLGDVKKTLYIFHRWDTEEMSTISSKTRQRRYIIQNKHGQSVNIFIIHFVHIFLSVIYYRFHSLC